MAAPTEADLAAGVPAGADIVKRVPAPSGKGELLLDANGGVYDTGGQSFSGSYFSLAPEQRQGTRSFQDIRVDPNTGGYTLVSNIPGQEYAFGPSQFVQNMPKANPLYSDPAFLSFVANAGLDYETAAGQVQRRKAAIQNALGVDVAEVKAQGKKNVEGVYDQFASRGLYGAGQQAVKEAEEQAATTRQVGRLEGTAAGEIEGLVTDLAQKRQDMLADITTKGYGTAGTQFLDEKLKEVDRKYPGYTKTGAV